MDSKRFIGPSHLSSFFGNLRTISDPFTKPHERYAVLEEYQNVDKGIGKPGRKKLLNGVELAAGLTSMVCLVLAICVVTPRLKLSWNLGVDYQIVVLGFILGLMNLCTQTVLPSCLLILEAKFGRSSLQNYDAILTGKFLSLQTSIYWRAVLLLTTALPLGLGVAYKQFIGGWTMVQITPVPTVEPQYGFTYPPLGDLAIMNNSVFHLVNVNTGFYAISATSDPAPNFFDRPVALGFNMLLLEEDATALLDLPAPKYLQWIQDQLRANETWQLSASVNATVARRNQTFENEMKNDDVVFEEYFRTFDVFGLFDSESTIALAMMILNGSDSCMIGFYNHTYRAQPFDLNSKSVNNTNTRSFRKEGWVFKLNRETCSATWNITRNSIRLASGSCQIDPTSPAPNLITGMAYYNIDTLPILVHAVGPYATTRANSRWRFPAITTAVVSAWWARAAYILGPVPRSNEDYPNLFYSAQNEKITSTNGTLHANWLLYLVISVHPLICIVAMITAAALYSVPVSKDFGLVSILAGVEASTLSTLQGASLSGNLTKPVILGFQKLENMPLQSGDVHNVRSGLSLRYTLSTSKVSEKTFKIRRGETYN